LNFTKEQEDELKRVLKEQETKIFICQKCKKEMMYKDVGEHSKENQHYEFKSKDSGANLGLLVV